MREKVSLITTFKDEEDGIERFLDSICSQTRLPDEIIMVDGGSADGTVQRIEKYLRGKIPVQLLVEDGCNISEGRNRAIREAGHDVIAVTDAGCILDVDWLKNLVDPLEKDLNVDVVAGNYRVEANGIWERVSSAYLMPYPEKVSSKTPSGRSTCFRKSAWKEVGGYPEWLCHAEDSYFAISLRDHGFRFQFSPGAIVRWRPRHDPISFFRQYFKYAVGDGKARLSQRHYFIKIAIYLIGIVLALKGELIPLLLLAILYIMLLMVRFWIRGKERALFLLLPPVVILHDIAQVTGYIFGSLAEVSKKVNNIVSYFMRNS